MGVYSQRFQVRRIESKMADVSVTVVPLAGCVLDAPLKFSGDDLNITVELVAAHILINCEEEMGKGR